MQKEVRRIISDIKALKVQGASGKGKMSKVRKLKRLARKR
jgi:hypothetical protein